MSPRWLYYINYRYYPSSLNQERDADAQSLFMWRGLTRACGSSSTTQSGHWPTARQTSSRQHRPAQSSGKKLSARWLVAPRVSSAVFSALPRIRQPSPRRQRRVICRDSIHVARDDTRIDVASRERLDGVPQLPQAVRRAERERLEVHVCDTHRPLSVRSCAGAEAHIDDERVALHDRASVLEDPRARDGHGTRDERHVPERHAAGPVLGLARGDDEVLAHPHVLEDRGQRVLRDLLEQHAARRRLAAVCTLEDVVLDVVEERRDALARTTAHGVDVPGQELQ